MCETPARLEENAISKGITFMEQILLLDMPALERVTEYLEARYMGRITARVKELDAAPTADKEGPRDGGEAKAGKTGGTGPGGSQGSRFLF
jgi:hypothetical protein